MKKLFSFFIVMLALTGLGQVGPPAIKRTALTTNEAIITSPIDGQFVAIWISNGVMRLTNTTSTGSAAGASNAIVNVNGMTNAQQKFQIRTNAAGAPTVNTNGAGGIATNFFDFPYAGTAVSGILHSNDFNRIPFAVILNAATTNVVTNLLYAIDEASFTNAVWNAPTNGTVRTLIEIPNAIRIHVKTNTVSLLRPYVDYKIPAGSTLVIGCNRAPGNLDLDTVAFNDAAAYSAPTTNAIYGLGTIVCSNNFTDLFHLERDGSYLYVEAQRAFMGCTNQDTQAPVVTLGGRSTFIANFADDLFHPAYDCIVIQGTNVQGRIKARKAKAFSQIWEMNGNLAESGQFIFEFGSVERFTNSLFNVPGGIISSERLFDMVDGIYARIDDVILGSYGFLSSPVTGNGTGILEAGRITQTAGSTLAAISGRNFTLKKATISGGTNALSVVGSNLIFDAVTIETAGSVAANSITAGSSQIVKVGAGGLMLNRGSHANVSFTGGHVSSTNGYASRILSQLQEGSIALTNIATDYSTRTLDGARVTTNSSSSSGVVTPGVAGKVWKADGSGNPDWRDDATGAGGGDAALVNSTAISDSFSLTNSAATATAAATTFSVVAGADPDPDKVSLAIGAASATVAGIVTAQAQTIAGAKTFSGGLDLQSWLHVGGNQTNDAPTFFSDNVSAAQDLTVSGTINATDLQVSGAATFNGLATASGPIAYTSTTIAGTDIDWNSGNARYKQLTANTTFTFSNPGNDKHVWVELQQDATGTRTVTWPTATWLGHTNQTGTLTFGGVNTNANFITVFHFWRRSATVYAEVVSSAPSRFDVDWSSGTVPSSDIAARVSDETGTGLLMFNNLPTMTQGATAGGGFKLTEDTDNGANLLTIKATDSMASDKTATFPDATGTVILDTSIDTSSDLATILTDETGSGPSVFANGPALGTFGGSTNANLNAIVLTNNLTFTSALLTPASQLTNFTADFTFAERHYLLTNNFHVSAVANNSSGDTDPKYWLCKLENLSGSTKIVSVASGMKRAGTNNVNVANGAAATILLRSFGGQLSNTLATITLFDSP